MPPQEQYTKEQLQAMKMQELVKLYNQCTTGQQIKRFESRAKAVERTMEALANRRPAPGVRTVRNGGKMGRPQLAFTVVLAEGKSQVRNGSLRGQIIAHLKTLTPNEATIAALEQKFTAKARGAVQKLLEVGHLKRKEATPA